MAGIRSGVERQLHDEESSAVYAHCYGLALNLACGNAIKQCGLIKDILDIMHGLKELFKKSACSLKQRLLLIHLELELCVQLVGCAALS